MSFIRRPMSLAKRAWLRLMSASGARRDGSNYNLVSRPSHIARRTSKSAPKQISSMVGSSTSKTLNRARKASRTEEIDKTPVSAVYCAGRISRRRGGVSAVPETSFCAR